MGDCNFISIFVPFFSNFKFGSCAIFWRIFSIFNSISGHFFRVFFMATLRLTLTYRGSQPSLLTIRQNIVQRHPIRARTLDAGLSRMPPIKPPRLTLTVVPAKLVAFHFRRMLLDERLLDGHGSRP